jgi:hypothetical protein
MDPRDGLELARLEDLATNDLAARWSEHGLDLVNWRPATAEDVLAMRSSWARRLGAGRDRSAWRLDLVRRAAALTTATSKDVGADVQRTVNGRLASAR